MEIFKFGLINKCCGNMKCWWLAGIFITMISCSEQPPIVEEDRLMTSLTNPYAPKEVTLEVPFWMPPIPQDDANPLMLLVILGGTVSEYWEWRESGMPWP
jgi:hypothetical protein